MTWDAIYRIIGQAAGVEPDLVHVPSDLIARIDPESGPGFLGDKSHSVVFDNSKIKRIAPGWEPRAALAEGASQMIDWFDADPARRRLDPRTDELHNLATRFMSGAVESPNRPI